MVEDCKSERLHEFLGLEPETITTLDELNGHINGVGEELKNYLYCLEPKYDGFYFDRRIDKDKLIIVVHPMYPGSISINRLHLKKNEYSMNLPIYSGIEIPEEIWYEGSYAVKSRFGLSNIYSFEGDKIDPTIISGYAMVLKEAINDILISRKKYSRG